MEQDLPSQHAARHVPRWVAPVIADFEMLGREVVSVDDVARALGAIRDSTRVKNAVASLVQLGWLRRLPSRGAYEFLPARGGPYPGGDPLVEVRGVLAKRPDLHLAVIGSGAAFLRGFAERAPARFVIAIDKTQGGSVALNAAYDVVRTTPIRIRDIPTLNGVPVSDATQLLADAALWPRAVGDLRNANHWLRRALADVQPAAAAATASRVGTAAAARMAYIARAFGAVDVADAVTATLSSRSRTFIGDRHDPVLVRDPRLGVDDHLGVAVRS
ncbi:MAG: hypothetical protein IT341_10845 [Chloroflexi bacterium]|nr:hypothetical protein [Chloroflexota bacterium]